MLGHMGVPFLVLKGASILFSIVAPPISLTDREQTSYPRGKGGWEGEISGMG